MTTPTPRRPRPAARPNRKPRPTRKRAREIPEKKAQVRHVKAQDNKPNKLVNIYIPRFISDTKTGGFFNRYHFERFYIHIVALTTLSIIYIANTFETHRLYYYETELNEQIKELRAKSLTIASIKMTQTRESAIYEQIQKRNIPLVFPSAPPLVIDIPKPLNNTTQHK